MGPMGPQGPQEGTGGTPRGTGTPPEARGHPQKPPGHFWKKSLFGLWVDSWPEPGPGPQSPFQKRDLVSRPGPFQYFWVQTPHVGPIGPQGPQEGGAGRPPMGPTGPRGPQEGTGSLPGGSPGQGEHGEEVRDDFWKTRFLASGRSPVEPGKIVSKQAPQPPGPISIDPFCFFAPGGCWKSLESLRGDPIRAKSKADGSQYFAQPE